MDRKRSGVPGHSTREMTASKTAFVSSAAPLSCSLELRRDRAKVLRQLYELDSDVRLWLRMMLVSYSRDKNHRFGTREQVASIHTGVGTSKVGSRVWPDLLPAKSNALERWVVVLVCPDLDSPALVGGSNRIEVRLNALSTLSLDGDVDCPRV